MRHDLAWFPGSADHGRRIEAAVAASALGSGFGPPRSGDQQLVVVRGASDPGPDLARGRIEGRVPDDIVARWFATFLGSSPHALITLEDRIHSPRDPAVLRRSRPGWWLPHGVAWPIVAGESAADALTALALLRGGPLLYGFHRLPPDWPQPADGTELSGADLSALRSSLVAVITDVYDWDGYIVWQRGDHDPSLPGPGR